ncbi:LysR family transcriptional regulator [Novosphingobium sp.]|uniref:LysR family transcriptional regulator n=1 Tax=Novosphingobium sp. TaxID=1874826 RepID=UPI0035B01A3F
MFKPGTPSIEQMRTFLAVVEEGSFAAAGRRLRRATSVVSYAIANLEAQLGVTLFEREGTKKPRLTDEGQAVLEELRQVERGLDGLRARVSGLSQGLEPHLSVVVDVMYPSGCLAASLQDFAERFPSVALTLHIEALGAVADLLFKGAATLGVAGPLAAELPGLTRKFIGTVELLPVAAPNHRLVHGGALADDVQLVLSDRSNLSEGKDFSVFSARNWRLGDLGAKHALLRAGLGWGNMPRWMVAEDLAAGRLVDLKRPERTGGNYPQFVVHRTDTPPGPAASWLAERLGQLDGSIAQEVKLA